MFKHLSIWLLGLF